MEIAETPGVIPSNSEPEHKIVFEDNIDEESNQNTEVDTRVDINKPRVIISGKVFGMQEFNINQIEDPWFDKSNATHDEYNEVFAEVISKMMCFYNDKLENMSREDQLSLLQNYILKKEIKNSLNKKICGSKENETPARQGRV